MCVFLKCDDENSKEMTFPYILYGLIAVMAMTMTKKWLKLFVWNYFALSFAE